MRAKQAADFAQTEVVALSPRSLTLGQQQEIANRLKPFAGHPIEIDSYGMDGEGTALATQLIALAFVGARLPVTDGTANRIVSGGFEWGIAIRGPDSEMPFMDTLQKSLISIGKLENVIINGPAPRLGGAIMGSSTVMGGTTIFGGGGPPVQGPIPTKGPVKVMVGIRPPVVLPKAEKQVNIANK